MYEKFMDVFMATQINVESLNYKEGWLIKITHLI